MVTQQNLLRMYQVGPDNELIRYTRRHEPQFGELCDFESGIRAESPLTKEKTGRWGEKKNPRRANVHDLASRRSMVIME